MSESKKQQLGHRFDDYNKGEPEVFGEGTLDDEMFAALESGSVSTDLIDINDIRADITQPRRIVPRPARGRWNGMPEGVPNLLNKWAELAGVSAEMIQAVLTGAESVHSLDGDDPVLSDLVKLLDLASQIYDVGLQQRIGVSTVGGGYQIIYGERRWMAFHALAHWVDEQYAFIPARVASVSPWELAKIQAAENFQRDELNAIEKARQFAKLLIISRTDTSDITYDPWQALVVEGGCDRPYYAQVADGNIHSIPYGMGSQFESALGISTGQMRNYRGLLKMTEDYAVNNWLWDLADENNWSERFLRDLSQYVSIEQMMGVQSTDLNAEQIEKAFRAVIDATKQLQKDNKEQTELAENRHHGDASLDNQADMTPSEPSSDESREFTPVSQLPPNPVQNPTRNTAETDALREKYLNKRVVLRGGDEGIVRDVRGLNLRVRMDDGSLAWTLISGIDAVKYVPGEADPVTRQVKTPSSSLPINEASDEDSYLSEQMDRMDEYDYEDVEEYEDWDDASDNEHSAHGDDLLDKQPMEVYRTLAELISLARQLRLDQEQEVVSTLFMMKTSAVEDLAKLSEAESDAVLVGYENKVAHLLEEAMKHVERYTRWIREQVADVREDSA